MDRTKSTLHLRADKAAAYRATKKAAAPPAPAPRAPTHRKPRGAAAARPESAFVTHLRELRAMLPGSTLLAPFAIGIKEDVLAAPRVAGISDEKLLRHLRQVVKSTGYLRTMTKPGARRYDIAGVPVGKVLPEHQEHAAFHINQRNPKGSRR
jgi:hypothetical protein